MKCIPLSQQKGTLSSNNLRESCLVGGAVYVFYFTKLLVFTLIFEFHQMVKSYHFTPYHKGMEANH